jgi:hypothetical protein
VRWTTAAALAGLGVVANGASSLSGALSPVLDAGAGVGLQGVRPALFIAAG